MTLDKLQNTIQELEASLYADDKKRLRLGVIDHELDVLRSDLLKSSTKLKKEKGDVEELEKKNLKSLFVQILGSIEDQIEKERQEYLQEVLHHNSLIDEIHTLEYEHKLLSGTLIENRKNVTEQLKQTIEIKENLLINNEDFKSKLKGFDLSIKKLNIKEKDIHEAIKEGRILMSNIDIVKTNLQKVKEWGSYKMYGKGKYSSYSKKNYIDKANKKVVVLNVYTNKFLKELKDVFPEMKLNLSIDFFENFLKHFYHNLITDWVIKRKLDHAIHGITIMGDKLNRIQMLLEKEKELNAKEKGDLEQKRKDFIVGFSV